MTVIRPNSISGVTSITGNGGDISIFRADGTAADVTVNNITSGVITATTFAGNVTGNVTGNISGNISGTAATFSQSIDVSGDKILNIPSGTTAERAGAPLRGNLRYNTSDAKIEFYDGNNWKNIGSSQPLVNNITPTTFDGTAGTIITIIGKDFVTGANVHFVSSVNGSSTAAGVVTFTNSTTLTAVLPALTTAGEPYGVKVTNPDGGQTLLEAALDAGASPTWTTSAGSLGSGIVKNTTMPSVSVGATDADGQALTYSETTNILTGSGSGKMGLTLNASSGAITGTSPNVSSDTTFNFTLQVADSASNTATRNFSYGIINTHPPVEYLYGGDVTCDYGTQGSYGISGGVSFGYYNHGGGNYSDTTRESRGSGFNGSWSGASSIPADHYHTQDGDEDGYYDIHCGGSGSTSVGITVGMYTGRLYVPSTHDRLRVELYVNSFTSNQQSNGGNVIWRLYTSVSQYAHSFAGSSVVTRNKNDWSDSAGGTFNSSRHDVYDISSLDFANTAYYWGIYGQGGQYADVKFEVYRLVTYNSAVGL
tara:strand:+ start:249 stop:1862 length:1614 start_codon:yes stop_codon:yes gene_type:complete